MSTTAASGPAHFDFPEPDIDLNALENESVQCGAYTISRTYDQKAEVYRVRIDGPASAQFEYDNARDSIDAYEQAQRSVNVAARIDASPNTHSFLDPAETASVLMQDVAESIRHVLRLRHTER